MAEYKVYVDTAFVAGPPIVIDLLADIGDAPKSFLIFIGKGRINAELSYDGTTYGDMIPLLADKKMSFLGLKAHKIRLSHSGVDSVYGAVAFPSGETLEVSTISELIAVVASDVTTTSVEANTSTTVKLLDANNARRGVIISASGNHDYWIKLQAAAVDDLKTGIYIDNSAGEHWEWTDTKFIYTGEVSVIAQTDTPLIHVLEY